MGGTVGGTVLWELGGVTSLPGWEAGTLEDGTLEDGMLEEGVLLELGASVGTQISYSGMGVAQPARSMITSNQLVIMENNFLFFISFPLSVDFKSIIAVTEQKVNHIKTAALLQGGCRFLLWIQQGPVFLLFFGIIFDAESVQILDGDTTGFQRGNDVLGASVQVCNSNEVAVTVVGERIDVVLILIKRFYGTQGGTTLLPNGNNDGLTVAGHKTEYTDQH